MIRQMRELSPALQSEDFARLLDSTVEGVKTDFKSGARQMADSALANLSSLIQAARDTAKSREDMWQAAVVAAKALSDARPSMNAAVTSCLLCALDAIDDSWDAEEARGETSPYHLARIARIKIDEMLKMRNQAARRLGENFAEYITQHSQRPKNHINIVTLSNSGTVRTCIVTALTSLPHLSIDLSILESRPRCEGADMASQILSSISIPSASQSRLHVRIFPDCAAGTAVRDADFVLLGADRISAAGDVSNKIGSLALALMTRCHDVVRGVDVVVVSDADKIAAADTRPEVAETHPSSELMDAWADETRQLLGEQAKEGNVSIFGEWFEWVPADYVDVYITENGKLDTADVKDASRKMGQLKEKIFKTERKEVEMD